MATSLPKEAALPTRTNVHGPLRLVAVLLAGATLLSCTPTVKLEAPDKPIVINLNVKIEQEVRVRIERDIDDLLREDDELF